MYYIGIDVAKRGHCMSVIEKGGEKTIEDFKFPNTKEGFDNMFAKLGSAGVTHTGSRVVTESTGHYGKLLCAHLRRHGFEVAVANPIQTHGFRNSGSVRKVKNDAADSLALAQWLAIGHPVSTSSAAGITEELKAIARLRTFQSQIIGDSKRKAVAILDQSFPEYEDFFSDAFGKSSLAVLKRYPGACAISTARIDSLSKLIEKASRGKLGRDCAQRLKALAKGSIAAALDDFGLSFALIALIELIEVIKRQQDETDARLSELMATISTPIVTIPGISTILGATILGEIGDVSRFKGAPSLVAFAGLDVTVFESGEFKGTKRHLTKRGSSYLRWALWLAADRSLRCDPYLSSYYWKKRSEGRGHKEAVCALARKLCGVIFAVLRDNKPYIRPDL